MGILELVVGGMGSEMVIRGCGEAWGAFTAGVVPYPALLAEMGVAGLSWAAAVGIGAVDIVVWWAWCKGSAPNWLTFDAVVGGR